MKNSKMRLLKKYFYPPIWVRRSMRTGLGIYNRILQRYPLANSNDTLSCDPLFIISAGRSGTTLMRSMLVASGEVAIPTETQIIHTMAEKIPLYFSLGWNDISKAVISEFESHPNFPLWETSLIPVYKSAAELPKNERSLAKIIDLIYQTYANEKFPAAKLWGDQSPIHTFALPYIDKVFPNAKYMHLLRDGRDVISSMVKRHGDDYIQEAVYRWKTSIRRINKFRKRIRKDNYLEVRYENLVKQPEDTLKSVSKFLGIKYTPKMLDYWKLPTTIEHKYKSFHKNLGKPVFASSVGKWKERLTIEQQNFVVENITRELRQLEYIDK